MLSAVFLRNVANVNSFDYTSVAEFYSGHTTDIYFQVVDSNKQVGQDLGYNSLPFRYMPAAGATMTVSLDALADSKKIVDRPATQPFAEDPSIWKVTLLPTDTIVGTVTLRFSLVEGAVTSCARITNALSIKTSAC